MTTTTVNADFQGLMDSIRKSKYPLAPIYEAITNALEAIFQKEYVDEQKPEITVTFDFAGILEDRGRLNFISFRDNGIGFNADNFKRFETLLDKSKGYNNRGSGRIQYVHRFSRIDIVSFYEDNGKHFKRSFSCNATRFIYDHKNEQITKPHASETLVTMIPGDTLGNDQDFYNNLSAVDIVRDLKRQFLLRFYIDSEKGDKKAPAINIVFSKNSVEQEHAIVKSDDMPKPSDKGELKVDYLKLKDPKSETIEWEPVPNKEETLKWAHFKLSNKDLNHNAVYLCSKGVSVEPITYDGIRKNEAVDGNLYLTAFYGDILDDGSNVSHSVDSFRFPDKKQIEGIIRDGDLFLANDEFLFFDTIKKEINKVIPRIYNDIIDLKKVQEATISEIARDHGISLDIAHKANVRLSDDKPKITEKLYKAQADELSKENQKIRKIFNELNTLNPTSENYQIELESKSKELLSLIPKQNKEELGRYIIRREMVAEVLSKIVSQKLDYQKLPLKKGKKKNKEGLIHDLIFKRKSKNTEPLNDLWILSEEYVHFDGCSELPLNQIADSCGQLLLRSISDNDLQKFGVKTDRRPDIFLYAAERKCVLVELKAPDIDLSNYLNQMIKYCNVIANYSTCNIQSFYCYLIGENINPITDLDGDYKETFLGDWVRPHISIVSFKDRSEIASAQIEVIKLSSIHERAHRRNKSFADKLGLRELLRNQS